MIISRTPYRISFFGGGTDYPDWYRKHGGAVLATTIDKYCYITSRHLPPFFEHRIRVVYSKIEYCQTIEEIAHPSVREVLRFLDLQRGVEIHHDGDLPARSGMGSSSAFTVGLLHALYALHGEMVEQAPTGHGERAPRAGRAEGDGRLAGPGAGRLRRLQPHHLRAERRDLGAARHAQPRPHARAELPPDALLHRHRAHGVDDRRHLRE